MTALRFIGLCLCVLIGATPLMSQINPDSTQGGKKRIGQDSTGIRILANPTDTAISKGKKGVKPDTSSAFLPTLPTDTPIAGVDTLDPLLSGKAVKKLERLKRRENRMLNHNPNGAVWRAFALPGWGQVYNRKYWKLPIVYGALGGLAYGVGFYHVEYATQRKAYICRNDSLCVMDDPYPDFSTSNLKDARDFSRRNRDLLIIVSALVYSLQALDAYVDAHLMHFDVSDNLSMDWMPNIIPDPRKSDIYLGLTVNFKLK